ncbi:sterol desaturase family protein [Rhodovibrionaceae bacterium A322]
MTGDPDWEWFMDGVLEQLTAYKGLTVGLWFLLFFIGERLRPAAREPGSLNQEPPMRIQRVGRNAILWGGNILLSALIVLPITYLASELALPWRPQSWTGWPALLVDLLILDCLIYWWHRANHVVPFLWRFHEVHHLDRFLDTTTAVRFHPGEVLLSASFRAGVIFLLDLPLTSVLVFEALVLLAALFHHSNLRLPERLEKILSRVVITPSIHWVHHHARQQDTDSNYGTFLSVWDRLFGSASPNARQLDMKIGVEGRKELPVLGLLLRPFVSQKQMKSLYYKGTES